MKPLLGFSRFVAVFVLVTATLDAEGTVSQRGRALADSWKSFRDQSIDEKPAFRFQYESCFRRAANQNNLPLPLLLAIARGESDFNPRAVSKANAIGIMQILWPATANELGIRRKSDLYKPCTNIRAGAKYLKFLVDRYGGDYHLALAAYNYGPGRIKPGAAPNAIPKGAQWYSAYIYDHLQYVLGQGSGVKRTRARTQTPVYSELGKHTVIYFSQPFRARAFRRFLQRRMTEVRFDWFDKGLGRYAVVMTYGTKQEFQRNIKRLKKLGL